MTENTLHNFKGLSLRHQFGTARVTQLMNCITRLSSLISQVDRATQFCPLIVRRIVGNSSFPVGAK